MTFCLTHLFLQNLLYTTQMLVIGERQAAICQF